MNLNRYAGRGSFIPLHCDNEHLFGKREEPKVIVSMNLWSLVGFRVCRRGWRKPPSPIQLDYGDLLVMDCFAQDYTPPCCRAPGSTLLLVAMSGHPDVQISVGWGLWGAAIMGVQRLLGLDPRKGEGGAFSMPLFWVVSPLAGGRCVPPRLPTGSGLSSGVAVLATAAAAPHGGVGHSLSVGFSTRVEKWQKWFFSE